MKIAIVAQPIDALDAPIDRLSSTTILSHHFATLLSRRGHDVTIYARSTDKAPVAGFLEETPNLRVVFLRTPRLAHKVLMGGLRRASTITRPRVPFIASPLYDPAFAIRVALDARRRGIEIVHVHNFSQYGPIIKAVHPGAKTTLHMHCLWLSHFDREVIRNRLDSFDEVICCSDFIRDAARRAFPDLESKIQTIHNGVDIALFDGAGNHAPGPDVYLIGRVSPEKGVHLLIEAFEQVVHEIPDARLYVVGAADPLPRAMYQTLGSDPVLEKHVGPIYDGHEFPPYLRMLQDQSGRYLGRNIHFLGPLSHPDLIARLRSAALVVQPSLCGEAFGMPAAEAMAMGLPVVVTRAGGLAEIVAHEVTGLIVERGDVGQLARAMIELLRSPARRRAMGAAGRQRALERFAFTDLAKQLENHYAALLTPSGGPSDVTHASQPARRPAT